MKTMTPCEITAALWAALPRVELTRRKVGPSSYELANAIGEVVAAAWRAPGGGDWDWKLAPTWELDPARRSPVRSCIGQGTGATLRDCVQLIACLPLRRAGADVPPESCTTR